MRIYLDDTDGGLSPSTSHPRFVAIAPEAFYDEGNDFAPFGSDDGNDALRDMEAWYETREPGDDPLVFLLELIAGWGFNLPDGALDFSEHEFIKFVGEDDMNEVYLSSVARACVAAALGQLKIEGIISESMQTYGRKGIRVQRFLAADTTRYPDWPHRAEALRALEDIEATLDAAQM